MKSFIKINLSLFLINKLTSLFKELNKVIFFIININKLLSLYQETYKYVIFYYMYKQTNKSISRAL